MNRWEVSVELEKQTYQEGKTRIRIVCKRAEKRKTDRTYRGWNRDLFI